MKIRIKGASVRYRLSRTDVSTITTAGYLEESTPFAGSRFIYALERTSSGSALTASFSGSKITMQVPAQLLEGWATNEVVGFDAHMPLEDGHMLFLLLEKDFQCIDQTLEDQSDNYINPQKNC